MYKLFFEIPCYHNYTSINAGFLLETGESASAWGYNDMQDILEDERNGFLEYNNCTLKVFKDVGD